MLFIKRKIGEAFRINDVQITITAINGNTATIGVSNSDNASVWREEVYKRIQQEKDASQSA